MEFAEIVIGTDRLDFPALAVGDGPVVVCWHGFPDHPATFGPLAERLVAAGRRVVAPFLRGHHPAHADAMAYADGLTLAADAAAVARALRAGDGGVDMIGHDIGAGMVARTAAAWPELVRGAVVMAVPPPAALSGLFADPAQLRRLFYMWLFQVPGLAEAALNRDLIDYLWRTWSPGLDPGGHLERVHALYEDAPTAANVLRVYRANFDTALHDPALAGLAAVTEAPASVPMLVLAGADDGCIPPSAFADAEAGLAPGSRVATLPEAGHFMHLDRPDEVAGIVLEWLR